MTHPADNQSDTTDFALLESFAEAVFLIDMKGCILNANSSFATEFGKCRNECIGADIHDLIVTRFNSPALAEKFRTKIESVFYSGKRAVSEEQINDTYRKITINPVLSPEKEIERLLVIIEDISEQRHTDIQCKKEHSLKNAVLDMMPGCAAALDAEGRLLVWNQFARKLILGKGTNKKNVSADDFFPVKEIFLDILNTGKENNSEVKMSPPGTGEELWIATRGKRITINGQQCVVAVGIDITEQKQAEKETENSRTRLTMALEAAKAGVWEWNPKTGESIWSDEIWALYGLEPCCKKTSFELFANSIHPDDRKSTLETLQAAAENETDLNTEYRVCHPNGSVHWLMSRGKPLFDSKGKIERYLGTIIDITERKKMEQALAESKKRFTFALEATNAGVWEWDLKADNVFWSDRIWALYGLEPDSLPTDHKLCQSTVHRADKDKTFQAVMSAASKEIEINVEYRVCHPDGSIRWLACRGMPLTDADHNLTCYIGTVMDITERKALDTSLKENELRFRSIFDHAPLAISIEDVETGTLIDANTSWLSLLGYSEEEVIDKPVSHLGVYADISESEYISAAFEKREKISNKPVVLRKRNGEMINVLYSSEFITLNEQALALVMMTDVTLQKTQQQNINQLEKAVADRTKQLQEEVKRLQRFLSMISHEYRTPLAIVRTNLDLVTMKNKMGDFSNKEEFFKINRAINRLVEVLEESIQESRISESHKKSTLTQFQIAPVITSQVEVFRNMWLERPVKYSECLNRCVMIGEQSQIKFAIFNLLDNARKYSPKDSTIEIECCSEASDAVIKIRNQGNRVSPDEVEKFFEKYQRGRNSVNTAGAGLGLWLVRNIVDQHHGSVTLSTSDSEIEATVRLPLVKTIAPSYEQ